jgi:hypothetical protein
MYVTKQSSFIDAEAEIEGRAWRRAEFSVYCEGKQIMKNEGRRRVCVVREEQTG